jgi:DNA segregation ATPase FtsK/SpoIIIE-like protein
LRSVASYFAPAELTADDLALARENDERRLLEKQLIQEAIDAQRAMINKLTAIGKCRRRVVDGSEKVLDEVWFDVIKFTPQAFYFHVGSFAGQGVMDLYNDEVCTDLSESVGHRVRSQFEPDKGLIYILERASTMGIPDFVSLKDMIDRIPKDASPLVFPAGVTANGRHLRRDLSDAPHLLIAGSSGGGKSNDLNSILCTFIMRNTPEAVRFLLFDIKGGVEFSFFYGLPHLLKITSDALNCDDGIIESPEDVLPALEWLMIECKRRNKMLKDAGRKNIREYNRGRRAKNRLPFIVAVVDEFATLKFQADKKCEDVLSALANISRAAGIHLIIATQHPKSEVINTKITTNFPWRMAFSMPSAASMTVIGSWDAISLSPKGRAIFRTPEETLQLQTPRVTDSTIRAIVASAKSGSADGVQMSAVDAEEIIKWTLDNLNGRLLYEALIKQFGGKLTQANLKDILISMDNQTFDIEGVIYNVIPPRGQTARYLEKAEQN